MNVGIIISDRVISMSRESDNEDHTRHFPSSSLSRPPLTVQVLLKPLSFLPNRNFDAL